MVSVIVSDFFFFAVFLSYLSSSLYLQSFPFSCSLLNSLQHVWQTEKEIKEKINNLPVKSTCFPIKRLEIDLNLVPFSLISGTWRKLHQIWIKIDTTVAFDSRVHMASLIPSAPRLDHKKTAHTPVSVSTPVRAVTLSLFLIRMDEEEPCMLSFREFRWIQVSDVPVWH